jgi:hypothetical protein
MLPEVSSTFTNLDVTIQNGKTLFCTPRTTVDFYSRLTIDDDGILAGVSGVDFNITSSIAENNYFNMASRGKLLLNSNNLTFNRPLRIPSTFPDHNTYPRIVVGGASIIRGTGEGSNNQIMFGAGPKLTYTYDARLEMLPAGKLILDNVQLHNKNFVL